MSLLTKVFKKVLKPVLKAVPGVGSVIAGVDAVNAARRAVSKTIPRVVVNRLPKLPTLSGSGVGGLPPIGTIAKTVGSIGAGALIGGAFDGSGERKKRRRGKGITARDLRSFKRVAKLVDKYAKPVHHFRNFKK